VMPLLGCPPLQSLDVYIGCPCLLVPAQIASRLSATPDTTGFQAVVQGLLLRMAWDHPYHTLYPLYALKNGRKGKATVLLISAPALSLTQGAGRPLHCVSLYIAFHTPHQQPSLATHSAVLL
jgi:hypothetical protein